MSSQAGRRHPRGVDVSAPTRVVTPGARDLLSFFGRDFGGTTLRRRPGDLFSGPCWSSHHLVVNAQC